MRQLSARFGDDSVIDNYLTSHIRDPYIRPTLQSLSGTVHDLDWIASAILFAGLGCWGALILSFGICLSALYMAEFCAEKSGQKRKQTLTRFSRQMKTQISSLEHGKFCQKPGQEVCASNFMGGYPSEKNIPLRRENGTKGDDSIAQQTRSWKGNFARILELLRKAAIRKSLWSVDSQGEVTLEELQRLDEYGKSNGTRVIREERQVLKRENARAEMRKRLEGFLRHASCTVSVPSTVSVNSRAEG